jgi:hypothetical protein
MWLLLGPPRQGGGIVVVGKDIGSVAGRACSHAGLRERLQFVLYSPGQTVSLRVVPAAPTETSGAIKVQYRFNNSGMWVDSLRPSEGVGIANKWGEVGRSGRGEVGLHVFMMLTEGYQVTVLRNLDKVHKLAADQSTSEESRS